jgi:hypothetical protein
MNKHVQRAISFKNMPAAHIGYVPEYLSIELSDRLLFNQLQSHAFNDVYEPIRRPLFNVTIDALSETLNTGLLDTIR